MGARTTGILVKEKWTDLVSLPGGIKKGIRPRMCRISESGRPEKCMARVSI